MKKRIFSLLLLVAMLVGTFPVAATYAAESTDAISLWCDDTAAQDVALYRGGCVYLDAKVRDGLSGSLQWQIETAADEWVDIQNATAARLRVSYGLVADVLAGGSARVRCVLSAGEDSYTSAAAVISVTDENPAPQSATAAAQSEPVLVSAAAAVDNSVSAPSAANEYAADEYANEPSDDNTDNTDQTDGDAAENGIMTLALEDEGSNSTTPLQESELEIYTITIEYLYAEGTDHEGERVAPAYTAEYPAGTQVNLSVTSPIYMGYNPSQATVTVAEALTADKTVTVYYSPAEVAFTVRHFLQNEADDQYTYTDTTVITGTVEKSTEEYQTTAAKNYTGFAALAHAPAKIAGDGSTVIDIYYDREYYLMKFDLAGGYGTEPIYARYGAAISVKPPTRAGYDFAGWTPALPSTMPAVNSTYTAQWTKTDSSYTVSYWLENPDGKGYSYVGSKSVNAATGTEVSGAALDDKEVDEKGKTEAERILGSDYVYYTYNAEKTAEENQNVTVAGDGSTVVRVYYDRKQYTLRFYYARSSTDWRGNTTYQIATSTGGSSQSTATDANDVVSAASWTTVSDLPERTDGKQASEKLGSTYTYYYIDLTAKYGANLEKTWPTAPLNNVDGYKFVSWGTQSGSGYNASNANKNIKGVYSKLDNQLVIDSNNTTSVNHRMVAYWNANPTKYTYEIYYSRLDGETKDRTYNGVEYKLQTTYTVGSTDVPSGQSPLSFAGVTYVGKDYDENATQTDGTVIRFYYTRNTHKVTFYGGYQQTEQKVKSVPYGGKMKAYLEEDGNLPTPKCPDSLPKDADENELYEFAGWYVDAERTEPLILSDGDTMQDRDLVYYAHWVPKTFTVTVYSDSSMTTTLGEPQSVPYNGFATAVTPPAVDDEFIGWFYTDATGAEHAFSFEGTPIGGNMDIYAKWRSSTSKTVTVNYVVQNADNSYTQIAESTRVALRVGQTHTFEVKTGSALYPAYRTNYFPTDASHSVTVESNPTDGENDYVAAGDQYVYNFVYKYYDYVPYTVEYKLVDANGVTRPAFRVDENGKAVFVGYNETWQDTYTEYTAEHDDNRKAIVTEVYVPEQDALQSATWSLPAGYVPDHLRQQLIVIPGDSNTITFTYTYTPNSARYSVNYYVENVTDGGYTLYQWSEDVGTVGDAVSAQAIDIAGYSFDSTVTEEKKQEGVTLSGTTLSGTILESNARELNFYYAANEYPYRVLYLEKDTLQVLAEPKTTGSDDNLLMAKYGATVTESAIDIADYRVEGSGTKSITIAQEATTDAASLNTIYFYYVRQSGGLQISKQVLLDATQAGEEGISALPEDVKNQSFTFTITAEKNLPKSIYYYTLTKADNTTEEGAVAAATRTITVSLQDGQSIYIKDLPLGTYTVTETYVSGFLAVTGGNTMGVTTTATVTEGAVAKVDYQNRYPFFTGDLVVRKQVTKLDESDPNPAEAAYYKVTVTLWPNQEAREIDRVIEWQNAAGAPEGAKTSYTIPKWVEGGTNDTEFSFDVYVPVTGADGAMGEVKLQGVPVGTFRVAEQAQTVGYITDYYKVTYDKAVHQNDETSGTGAVVNGDIHGGHPTAVTFTNTYKKGTLTIEKTVTQEYANDSFSEQEFTFTVTGTTELPDGDYTLANGQTATVANGVVTLPQQTITVTKDDPTASVTLGNLPAGYYTVTETAVEGFTCQSKNPGESVLVSGAETKISFENRFDRTSGSLRVSKTIELVNAGVSVDTNKDFEFTLRLTDGTLAGPYGCTVYDKNDTAVAGAPTSLTVVDGEITFTLKHDQYIVIGGLPVGVYDLLEKNEAQYASTFDPAPEDDNHTGTKVTVKTGETAAVACSNRYPVDTATLVVKKSVTAEAEDAINQPPEDDRFQFEVTVKGFDAAVTNLSQTMQYTFYGADGKALDSQPTVTVQQNGTTATLTFTLADGQYVKLTLPMCSFSVSETALVREGDAAASLTEHYETAYQIGDVPGEAGKTYSLAGSAQELWVTVTNTYKRHYADLTIQTTTAREEQNFLFDVASTDGNIKLSVVLEGNDSITVRDLPVGQYTVTEQDKWSWREITLNGQTVTPADKGTPVYSSAVTLDDVDVTVAFNYGAVDRNEWLSGYSYGVNRVERGGG